jgi:hypothetical protein
MLDGGLQSYIIIFVVYLFYAFIKSSKQGDTYQDQRVLAFYRKYCNSDGSLQKIFASLAMSKKENDS